MRIAGRLHAATITALADPPVMQNDHQVVYLRAPMPAVFVPAIDHGDLVTAGSVIGQLQVLGRPIAVLASQVSGFAIELLGTDARPLDKRIVAYGDILVVLDLSQARLPGAGDAAQAAATAAGDVAVTGRVFRAPTSGRFYGRSAPDKPPFVTEGSELTHGATICLLEVMKTFHRVTYSGADLPDTARVSRVLVAEGADVNAGDPLLALE